jgi:hypothetical protein
MHDQKRRNDETITHLLDVGLYRSQGPSLIGENDHYVAKSFGVTDIATSHPITEWFIFFGLLVIMWLWRLISYNACNILLFLSHHFLVIIFLKKIIYFRFYNDVIHYKVDLFGRSLLSNTKKINVWSIRISSILLPEIKSFLKYLMVRKKIFISKIGQVSLSFQSTVTDHACVY